jgi:Protein of unknown function (DUF2795)
MGHMNTIAQLTPSTTKAASVDAALVATLRSVDYPATREDLVRAAVMDGLQLDAVDALHAIPNAVYQSTFYVVRALEASSTSRMPEVVGDGIPA